VTFRLKQIRAAFRPAALLIALAGTQLMAAPLGSAFSYQGHLSDGAGPANGQYDLRFELFMSEAGGISPAPAVTNSALLVSNGLFTTTLDFGRNAFAGNSSWLEIGVRHGGSIESFVTLSPRQSLTPSPYAIYTLKAESLNGPLPDSQLSTNVARLDANQTFSGAVTFTGQVGIGSSNAPGTLEVNGSVHASSFTGNGSGLSNIVATGISAKLAQKLWRVSIPFVTVGNPGNDPDPETGKGAVAYPFRIGKFEINNAQYVVFLNAVASTDTYWLYDTNMTTDSHGGIKRSGFQGDFSYSVKSGMEHQPVVWVDYHDALRFCNWLHNGQPSGVQDVTTTEEGAYTLTPEGILNNTVARNPGARFWLPSDDEWYKAAYHHPPEDDGPPTGYWLYPTRSNSTPTGEPPPGAGNSMNACCETGSIATDVGAYFRTPSYYGTFDQAGNVQEWDEEILYTTNRRIRGGSWNYNEFYAKSTDFEFDTPDYPADGIGFRVAGAAEP
jgi:formylglycine-generating enzyme